MRPNFHSAAIALSALLLSACGDPSPAPAEPAGTEAMSAPAVTAARTASARDGTEGRLHEHAPEEPQRDLTPVDARIESVTLSNQGDTEDHTIGVPTREFDPGDTVYLEVRTKGTAPEYDLYAKWLSPSGEVLSDYGVRVSQGVDSRTVISLSKPDGLLRGENRIEVAINGQSPRVVTYRVR